MDYKEAIGRILRLSYFWNANTNTLQVADQMEDQFFTRHVTLFQCIQRELRRVEAISPALPQSATPELHLDACCSLPLHPTFAGQLPGSLRKGTCKPAQYSSGDCHFRMSGSPRPLPHKKSSAVNLSSGGRLFYKRHHFSIGFFFSLKIIS
jgi:hypothetical protein